MVKEPTIGIPCVKECPKVRSVSVEREVIVNHGVDSPDSDV